MSNQPAAVDGDGQKIIDDKKCNYPYIHIKAVGFCLVDLVPHKNSQPCTLNLVIPIYLNIHIGCSA